MKKPKYIKIDKTKLDDIIKDSIEHITNELSLGNYMEIISSVRKGIIKNSIKIEHETAKIHNNRSF